jgi:hypothetical protein
LDEPRLSPYFKLENARRRLRVAQQLYGSRSPRSKTRPLTIGSPGF